MKPVWKSGSGAMLPALSLILCAACSAPGEPSSPTPADSTSDPSRSGPITDGSAIAGLWDVASFGGYEPAFRLIEGNHAAFADFYDGGVRLRMECNYSGEAGELEDGRFASANPDDPSFTTTSMACGDDGAMERERAFFIFFRQHPTVEWQGSDRLRLVADGTELILDRPERRRLAHVPPPGELQGKWRMVGLTRYLPHGGYSGGGLHEVPGRIAISGDRLEYTRCPQFALDFALEDGRLVKRGGRQTPGDAAQCAELQDGYEPHPDQPRLWDVMRVLHGNPAVERSGEGTITLSTDEFAVTITQQPCRSQWMSDDHTRTEIRDCASPE